MIAVLVPFILGRKTISFIMIIVFVLIGIISILSILLYYPHMSVNVLDAFADKVSFIYIFMFGKILFFIQSGSEFFKNIDVAPWCLISAYAVGLITGFFFVNFGREYRVNRILKSLELYWLTYLVYLQLIQIIFLLQVVVYQYLFYINHLQEHSGLLLLDDFSFYVVLIKKLCSSYCCNNSFRNSFSLLLKRKY